MDSHILNRRLYDLLETNSAHSITLAINLLKEHQDDFDLSLTDSYGNTPIMIAVIRNQMELLMAMIDLGHRRGMNEIWLNVVKRSGDGRGVRFTILHIATISFRINMIPLLIQVGAKQCPDGEGLLPLHRLIHLSTIPEESNLCFRTAVVLLQDGSFDIDAKTNRGNTALFLAVVARKYELIDYLLRLGSKALDITNNSIETPLGYATSKNDKLMMKYLLMVGSGSKALASINQVTWTEEEMLEVRVRVYFSGSLMERLLRWC